ncbi:hypothetical protein Pmani_023249 [Petrolisthes manimaculis]|uniref:Uncharacterized protein n=1 Tax=Petrolisthes manimaculis TaxID=1843537 RepID=A0AAE1PC85_9EUCA|nr:hypothetical protein Pmani_023249 [Petrolisthes manimaculis]
MDREDIRTAFSGRGLGRSSTLPIESTIVGTWNKTGTVTGRVDESDASVLPSTSAVGGDGPSRQSHPLTISNIIHDDISALLGENMVMVNTIVKAVQFIMHRKDEHINQLKTEVITFENRVSQLENQIDDVNQYERRDTLIISDPSFPQETNSESAADVVVDTIREKNKINISHNDINVAHRFGSKTKQNKNKPMIVKLHNCPKKEEIMSACITMRPNL